MRRPTSVLIVAVVLGGLSAPAQEQSPPKAQEIRRIDTGEQGAIRVAVSPDGQLALSGGTDGTVRLWELKTGKELKQLKEHTGQSYIRSPKENRLIGYTGG
jgi:WD40 repeat protein